MRLHTTINMKNGEAISQYLNYLAGVKNLKESTITSQKHTLTSFSKRINKDFKQATEQDIINYLKKYADLTHDVRLNSLKKFYKWLYKLDENEPLPDFIKRIETKYKNPLEYYRKNINYKERVVSEEEYNTLIDNSYKIMHKAMLETLWLFGCRAGELLSMNSNDVSYDGKFTRVLFRDSKTVPRENVYHGRAEHLLKWAETYQPFKGQKGKPLWVTPRFTHRVTKETSYNTRFTINGLEKMIKVISDRGNIRKITPHDFRHTFVSRERKNGTPQTFIESNGGFRKGTMMMEVYDHNKTKDYEDYLIKSNKPTPVTYELLEKQKQRLENTHYEEIQNLSDLYEELRKELLILKGRADLI